MTNRLALAACLLAATCLGLAAAEPAKPGPFSVFVFSETKGFRHGSIADGIAMVKKLGADNGFGVDASEDPTLISADNLKKYKVVIFLNTTGPILSDEQHKIFEAYIKAGNGFVGIHSATDTEYTWPWYNGLVGAYFAGHPAPQKATVDVIDRTFIATKHLPEKWEHTDEWYNFKSVAKDLKILAKVDETTYNGGGMKNDHPVIWYHEYEGGRAFYSELGHPNECYKEPLYQQMILGGIYYAAGVTAPAAK